VPRDNAEFVIGGVTGALERPVTLPLGHFDDHGTFRFVGQRHQVKADGGQDAAPALRGLPFWGPGAGHACPLPAAWTGNFAERQPLVSIRAEATVVAEVEVDTALDGPVGGLRHRGRLVRIRLDLDPADVTTGRAEARRKHADPVGLLAEAGHR
jgi:hypothetical protein